MKFRDQTSVLLSVLLAILCKKDSHHSAAVNIFSKKMNLINLGKNILMIKSIHQQRNTKITDSYHVYENRSMLFRRFLFLRQKSFHPRYVNLPFPTFFRDHQTMLGFGPTLFGKIFHAIGSYIILYMSSMGRNDERTSFFNSLFLIYGTLKCPKVQNSDGSRSLTSLQIMFNLWSPQILNLNHQKITYFCHYIPWTKIPDDMKKSKDKYNSINSLHQK